MTVVLSVLYPDAPGGRFDMQAYLDEHIPLVRRSWDGIGLLDVRILRGLGTPDGAPAPYRVAAHLTFASADALRRALDAHGAAVFAHIPSYTDIRPLMQISEVVG
jgi:uncharacterized protein (TIGR02118 family)